MERLFAISVHLLLLACATAGAGPPRVQFDAAYTVGCRDVTGDDFAAANPDERLVEARFHVSSLLLEGSAGDLAEFFILISSPRHSLAVVDYLPATTLSTDIAGTIQVETREETTAAAGVTVSGAWQDLVKGGASADAGLKRSESVKYEKLPPKESIAAAGTLARGSGVYFKLRPSTQTSLEGGREFVVVFRVGQDWRADVVQVVCRATGFRRGPIAALDERVPAGEAQFAVALYAAGDEAAKRMAQEYASSLHALQEVAGRQAEEIERRSLPSLAHRFGRLVSVVDGRIPEDWLSGLIHGGTSREELAGYAGHLPPEAKRAALRFARAREAILAAPAMPQFPVGAPAGEAGVVIHLHD